MNVTEQIFEVVRGRQHWSSLEQLGVRLDKKSDSWTWQIPDLDSGTAPVDGTDIAQGLLALTGRPDALREWASFILAAASIIGLEDLESSVEGEALLEALWDASAGESIETSTIALARSLRAIQ